MDTVPRTQLAAHETIDRLHDAIGLMVSQWPDRKDGFAQVCLLCEVFGKQLRRLPMQDAAHIGPELETVNKLCTRGIFLGGSPKGGTTMFVQLFDSHPDLLTMPGDSCMIDWCAQKIDHTKYERLLGAQLRQLIAPNGQPPFWNLGESLEPYRFFVQAHAHWFEKLAQRQASGGFLSGVLALAGVCKHLRINSEEHEPSCCEPVAFVEKTCANVLKPEVVYGEFPHAVIVQIVRDPYTTLAALDRQTKVRNWSWSFADRLDYVRQIVQAAVVNPSRFGSERYRLVRYEALVAKPERVMGDVASWLGIEFDPILCTPTVLGRQAASNSMFSQRRTTGKLISEPSEKGHERYRQAFGAAEQRTICGAIGHIAESLGYGLPKPG